MGQAGTRRDATGRDGTRRDGMGRDETGMGWHGRAGQSRMRQGQATEGWGGMLAALRADQSGLDVVKQIQTKCGFLKTH